MIDSISPTGPSVAATAPVAGSELVGRAAVAPGTEAAGADFGVMVTQLASDAAGAVRNAETMSVAGIQGRATIQQVVETVMHAEQTLQGAVAIRDKVVAAYLELSRMQI